MFLCTILYSHQNLCRHHIILASGCKSYLIIMTVCGFIITVGSLILYVLVAVLYLIPVIYYRFLRGLFFWIIASGYLLAAVWLIICFVHEFIFQLYFLILKLFLYPLHKAVNWKYGLEEDELDIEYEESVIDNYESGLEDDESDPEDEETDLEDNEPDLEEYESVGDENIEYVSHPLSLLHALKSLPEGLGQDYMGIEDITTLNIHVVTSSPLLDPKSWKSFMNALPELKRLNLVYIIQIKANNQAFKSSKFVNNNHIITYAVQQMHYHMYFSSDEYTEPDVVVIYDNTTMIPASGDDDINSEISFRNMISGQETILVLMDEKEELVEQGVRAVNAARPVDQVVRPNQINPVIRIYLNESDPDSNTVVLNKTHYFTCLRRQ